MSGIKRRNRISSQWSPRLIDMLESPAYCALSLTAHRIISRVEIELAHHGGNDSGKLPLTYEDLIQYGADRAAVAPAIRKAEALGFIRVTEHGRGGNREYRRSNLFFLTFAYGRDSRGEPPHDRRKIKTIEQALAIAKAARLAKDPQAVARGQKYAQRRAEKQRTGARKNHASGGEPHIERALRPMRESHTTGSPEKPASLSISRVRGRSDPLTEAPPNQDQPGSNCTSGVIIAAPMVRP
jgi:hypothetical protein